jgi:serine O-acetyltransferase
MFQCIKADARRLLDQEHDSVRKLATLLFNLGFHAVVLYRFSNWLYRHGMGPLGGVVGYMNTVFTGAQISGRATIGKGLVIYHAPGIVIGEAKIGDYCTLIHANLIGQHRGGGDRPTIGNHFYAGTGAKIMGRIQIGNYVRVGANAVVLQSLPDNVTAVGVPARIIAHPGQS